MQTENHPDYNEELKRCNDTLMYVAKTLKEIQGKKEKMSGEIDKVQKHYSSESSQDYIELTTKNMVLNTMGLKVRNLTVAKDKPYFARVDFKETDKNEHEKLYIGKMSLMREEDQQVIIVDWRAPVANLYYEGRLGDASYVCPDGNIHGKLLVKRQFTINGGEMQGIFDIDITTNDDFIQSSLGATADSRLKDIVSTIQAEQNRIIRADMWKPLIVQGVAGSGKTTITLHRIAYLIYKYEKDFRPENFMIIAPNKLFLNYISEVLPELGVERVKQATFDEFATELIGKKLKMKDDNERLTNFVNSQNTLENSEKYSALLKVAGFKSSMHSKEILDLYIEHIEENFIPLEDFKLFNIVIYDYESIKSLFVNEYKRWPFVYRINEIKKHLQTKLSSMKDRILNNLHSKCDTQLEFLKSTMADSNERQILIIKGRNKITLLSSKMFQL